jgi:acyl-CoA synthetase (AMP-forming)/AMP-acid ligase II
MTPLNNPTTEVRNIKPSQHLKQRLYSSENTTHHWRRQNSHSVPLYHCFGMVLGNLSCISKGATMIYPNETFDAKSNFWGKATAIYGVPTMFFAELAHPDKQYDLSSLRTGIMAGSLCPSELMKRCKPKCSRNGNWLAWRPVRLALKPDTMRHLTKELVQW